MSSFAHRKPVTAALTALAVSSSIMVSPALAQSLTATPTATPSATATPTATPTSSATPTPTPAPVADNAPADLVMTVGKSEAERNFTWYTADDVAQVIQFAPKSGADFPAQFTEVAATSEGLTTSGEYNHKATIAGLKENTEYVYRVGNTDTGFSEAVTFKTQSFSGDYNFLFYGDPQVGASGDLAADEAGWVDTVNVGMQKFPQSELLFSAGDQVNKPNNEDEYNTFLKPEQLKSLPLVPTIGNHDVGSLAYSQHYNVPNNDPQSGKAKSELSSGGDYWFIYKDVLYINLNSNSRDYAAHNAFMEKVVAEHGNDVKWKVVAFHHSIYSVAAHTYDDDIIDRRNSMPAKISELGIDLVLMGHDHSYTRTFLLNSEGKKSEPNEVAGQKDVVKKDGEVLYVTANSASGSKYYDIWAPREEFSSVINQEMTRNYTNVEVKDCSIALTTYRSEANPQHDLNSVVDEVTLHKGGDCAPKETETPAPKPAPGSSTGSSDSSWSSVLTALIALLAGVGLGISAGLFTPIIEQIRQFIGR